MPHKKIGKKPMSRKQYGSAVMHKKKTKGNKRK